VAALVAWAAVASACAQQEQAVRAPGEPAQTQRVTESTDDKIEARATVTSSADYIEQPDNIDAFRRPFPARLQRLWRRGGVTDDSLLLLPTEVHLSRAGLLVFDVSERSIRVFDAADGAFRYTAGREGRGPGEFSIGFWFMGTYEYPMAFDLEQRRVTALNALPTLASPVALPNRRLKAACALDSNTVMGWAGKDSLPPWLPPVPGVDLSKRPDFLIVSGDSVLDSLPSPWPDMRSQPEILRQSTLRQVSADECAIMLSYGGRFALRASDGRMKFGTVAESIQTVQPDIKVAPDGRSGSISLPRTARVGPMDARRWRDFVVILYSGKTALADRILDFHRASDLSYAGSLVLPERLTQIAIHGDTLSGVGNRDDYPVLTTFVLIRK
jgi:hypothetical protein